MKPDLKPYPIGNGGVFQITPTDIEVSARVNFVGASNVPASQYDHPDLIAYNNEKMNEGATIVINACQRQGHWGPCKPYELVRFHEEATFSLTTFLYGNHRFRGMMVETADGQWQVTDLFIIYCYLAAGKNRQRFLTGAAGAPDSLPLRARSKADTATPPAHPCDATAALVFL